jgi:hypothetical protein
MFDNVTNKILSFECPDIYLEFFAGVQYQDALSHQTVHTLECLGK